MSDSWTGTFGLSPTPSKQMSGPPFLLAMAMRRLVISNGTPQVHACWAGQASSLVSLPDTARSLAQLRQSDRCGTVTTSNERDFVNRRTFLRSVLGVSLAGVLACSVGCSEKTTPMPVVPASDLPFVLACTVNEQETVDLTTVIEVPAGDPIRVFGTLRTKPGEAFARSGKLTAVFQGFEPTPLPDPMRNIVPGPNRKPNPLPTPDKPEHLHASLIVVVVPFGTQPNSLDASEFGLTNQYVDPDRQTLTYSGGLLCPSRPGKYTLRLWVAFKREREFRQMDDRNLCGKMKTIREITLISTKVAD